MRSRRVASARIKSKCISINRSGLLLAGHGMPSPTPATTRLLPRALLKSLSSLNVAPTQCEPVPTHLNAVSVSPTPATTSMPKARRAPLKTRNLKAAPTAHDMANIHLYGSHAKKRIDVDHGVGLENVSMMKKVEWARTNLRNLRINAELARSTRPASPRPPSKLADARFRGAADMNHALQRLDRTAPTGA